MELIERYLLHLVLALAIITYAIVAVVVSTASSPIEASIVAGVPHTPVVLSVRFQLHGVGFTVAVQAQLRQEPSRYALRPDLAERTTSNDQRTFDPARPPRQSQRLSVTGWRHEEKHNKALSALIEWRADLASAAERAARPQRID